MQFQCFAEEDIAKHETENGDCLQNGDYGYDVGFFDGVEIRRKRADRYASIEDKNDRLKRRHAPYIRFEKKGERNNKRPKERGKDHYTPDTAGLFVVDKEILVGVTAER